MSYEGPPGWGRDGGPRSSGGGRGGSRGAGGGGGGRGGRGRHPGHLKGREIGLWYARKQGQKNRDAERQEVRRAGARAGKVRAGLRRVGRRARGTRGRSGCRRAGPGRRGVRAAGAGGEVVPKGNGELAERVSASLAARRAAVTIGALGVRPSPGCLPFGTRRCRLSACEARVRLCLILVFLSRRGLLCLFSF